MKYTQASRVTVYSLTALPDIERTLPTGAYLMLDCFQPNGERHTVLLSWPAEAGQRPPDSWPATSTARLMSESDTGAQP